MAKNHVKNIFNKVFSAAAVWRPPRHSPLKRRTTTGVETTLSSFYLNLDLDSISVELFLDEEELTCNVCDRSFETPRQLERHQVMELLKDVKVENC